MAFMPPMLTLNMTASAGSGTSDLAPRSGWNGGLPSGRSRRHGNLRPQTVVGSEMGFNRPVSGSRFGGRKRSIRAANGGRLPTRPCTGIELRYQMIREGGDRTGEGQEDDVSSCSHRLDLIEGFLQTLVVQAVPAPDRVI